ncbi:hypothetical protein [Kitasatospora sp. P5_F3]
MPDGSGSPTAMPGLVSAGVGSADGFGGLDGRGSGLDGLAAGLDAEELGAALGEPGEVEDVPAVPDPQAVAAPRASSNVAAPTARRSRGGVAAVFWSMVRVPPEGSALRHRSGAVRL